MVIVGCGALGSVAADMLARAGVGRLRLIDRDVLELSNLHRQAMYTEADVASRLPKAVAASAHLVAVDASLAAEAVVADLDGASVLELLRGADVVLDGTDNFEARHVLNEACLDLAIPWVHAACLGATAVAWPIVPGRTACFACAVPGAPGPGEVETCETTGVIGPAVHLAAGVQAAEAMKILAGRHEALLPGPWTWDAWTGRGAVVRVERDPACTACGLGERRFLGRARQADAIACGRGAVQLTPASPGGVDLDAVAKRLQDAPGLVRNRWLLRFADGTRDVTIFRDGRILVSGTREPSEARAIASRWLGG